jgi:hypothetical protein
VGYARRGAPGARVDSLVIFALVFLIMSTGPAAADPGTLGALTLSAVGVEVVATSTAAVVTGNIIISAALLAASIGVQAYLARQNAQEARSDGQLTTRQASAPRRRGYGQYVTGGQVIFSEVAIISGLVTRCELSALHEGEIDAFVSHRLDDHHSVFSGGDSGTLVTGEFHVGATPYVALETRKGTDPSTAYAILVANFPDIWSDDHRGDGVASALVLSAQPPNFDNFTTAFPGGAPPTYRAEIRASKVWDPRAGGQSRSNRATWAWRNNGPVCILDFLRHEDGMGFAFWRDIAGVVHYEATRDGALFTSAALTEDWIPAANIADEDSGGGIPRYRVAGSYALGPDGDDPADVLAGMLAACDAQLYHRPDGAIGIRVGKTVAPAITLTDDHILGYSDLKKGGGAFIEANEITAKFTSPEHDYQLIDAQPWRDEADIAARGRVITKGLSLPWVPHHSQCRRLMKIALARANPAWRGTFVTDMAGLALINERHTHLTVNEVGFDAPPLLDHDFEIAPDSFSAAIGDKGLRCTVGAVALAQAAYDWDEDEEAGGPPAVPADQV